MNEASAMKYLEVPVDNVTLVEETNGSYHFGRVEASVVLSQMADLVNEAMEFASTEVFRHETQIVRRLEAVLHVLQETQQICKSCYTSGCKTCYKQCYRSGYKPCYRSCYMSCYRSCYKSCYKLCHRSCCRSFTYSGNLCSAS